MLTELPHQPKTEFLTFESEVLFAPLSGDRDIRLSVRRVPEFRALNESSQFCGLRFVTRGLRGLGCCGRGGRIVRVELGRGISQRLQLLLAMTRV